MLNNFEGKEITKQHAPNETDIVNNDYNSSSVQKNACHICGELCKSQLNIDGKATCPSCYHKYYRPKKECAICGKIAIVRKIVDNQAICQSCYKSNYAPQKKCFVCGTLSISAKKTEFGPICTSCYNKKYRPKQECYLCKNTNFACKIIDKKPICLNCYNKYYRAKYLCSICNNETYRVKKDGENSICQKCYDLYHRKKQNCKLCSNLRTVHKYVDNEPICNSCYDKHFRNRCICSICQKENIVKTKVDGKPICPNCYNKFYRKKSTCSICGKEAIIEKRDGEKRICSSCNKNFYYNKVKCSICGTIDIVKKKIGNQTICPSCYRKSYRPKKKCDFCNKIAYVSKIVDGKRMCNKCYKNFEGSCIICGTITKNYFGNGTLCDKCLYQKKSNAFFDSIRANFSSSEIYELYKKYKETLPLYRTPNVSYFNLLRMHDLFKYLDDKKIDIKSLSIKYMYTLTDQFHYIQVQTLSNFLLCEAIIEPIDVIDECYIIRNKYIRDLTDTYRNIFINYSDQLINQNKNKKAKGWYNKISIQTFRNNLNTAYFLLKYLQNNKLSLKELNDNLIDDIILENESVMMNIRQLIIWLNKNVLMFKRLKMPKSIPRSLNAKPYSEEEYYELIEGVLSSKAHLKHKIICLLCLIYAIRPKELIKITIDDLIKKEGSTYLLIRGTKIQINKYVAELIYEYIEHEKSTRYSFGQFKKWMFVGRKFDTSISFSRVCKILEINNISSHRAFSTVITNALLGPTLPYVIIKGLGISAAATLEYYKFLNIDSMQQINYLDESRSTLNYNDYFIYILHCNDDSYYTGYTSNLNNRIKQHTSGFGCTYTKRRLPVELVYFEKLSDKSSAIKREKQIKKLTTFEKENLINKSRMN